MNSRFQKSSYLGLNKVQTHRSQVYLVYVFCTEVYFLEVKM